MNLFDTSDKQCLFLFLFLFLFSFLFLFLFSFSFLSLSLFLFLILFLIYSLSILLRFSSYESLCAMLFYNMQKKYYCNIFPSLLPSPPLPSRLLPSITLHYTTLHFTSLHYTSLHVYYPSSLPYTSTTSLSSNSNYVHTCTDNHGMLRFLGECP